MTTTFKIIRDAMNSGPTTGVLYPPDGLSVFTLEDPWKDNEKRVSCIPTGTYRVVMSMSKRFGRVMPELLNVPDRDNIRVHGGNVVADTEGCILVGMERDDNGNLVHSQRALSYMMGWLWDHLLLDRVYCEISVAGEANAVRP